MHYGPSFLSNGERERAEPILYIHAPNTDQLNSLKRNVDSWVTPFDVHQTVKDLILRKKTSSSNEIGTSLLSNLGHSRRYCNQAAGVPERFCAILQPKLDENRLVHKTCTFLQEPPSALSFYADIPRNNRPSWPLCKKEVMSKSNHTECYCATICQKKKGSCLQKCDSLIPKKVLKHPISFRACRSIKKPYHTEFDISINIKTEKNLETRHIGKKSKWTDQQEDLEIMPNILFVEIDSLSHKAALRHMPKTLSLLQSHKMMKHNEKGGKIYCPSGFCAAMFNKTSIVGQQSIPNQLAALSGCTDRNLTGVDSYLRPPLLHKKIFETWCPKSDLNNTWLFDIVKDLGYVSFFGEEFCYSGSQYIVQDNAFTLDVDYDLIDIFCKVNKAHEILSESTEFISNWLIEFDTSKNPNPCLGELSKQELALKYITGIWNAYPKTPKFAYINSLAAHDYSVGKSHFF